MRLIWEKINQSQAQKIKTVYFQNKNLQETALDAGCAIGTAHAHTKNLEKEIEEKGLLPVLNKYGLDEAKDVAQLSALIVVNKTTAEEVFRCIPLARNLVSRKIKPDDVTTVVDQVFVSCPPELRPQLAEAIVDYAKEHAKTDNLTISDLRTEYHTLTTRVEKLEGQETLVRSRVQTLQVQEQGLTERIKSLTHREQEISSRVAKANQTDASLTAYSSDRIYLHDVIGIDISNIARTRHFFQEMERLGYNPAVLARYIRSFPSLVILHQTLLKESSDLIEKIDGLKRAATEQNVLHTNAERARQEAERRARHAEAEADAKIAASKQRISDQMNQEHITLADIEDVKKFKKQLRDAGIEP